MEKANEADKFLRFIPPWVQDPIAHPKSPIQEGIDLESDQYLVPMMGESA